MKSSLNEWSNPRFLKMCVIPNLKQTSVKKFARAAFADNSVICGDGYCSYIPALEGYTHEKDFLLAHSVRSFLSIAVAYPVYKILPNKLK